MHSRVPPEAEQQQSRSKIPHRGYPAVFLKNASVTLLSVFICQRKFNAVLRNQQSDIVIFIPQIFIMKMEIKLILRSDNVMIMVTFINKRNNILKYLDRNIQTIITTTDIKNINEKIKEKTNVYEIKEGKIISREIISKQEGD